MPSSPPSPPRSAGRHDAHVLERLREALHGRYEVQKAIARGGMSMVYRARDLRHDRQVAVKVLPPDLATSIASERFVFEIRTAAQLLHPHILGLIDSGDADGLLYYIMPHVDGESLRDKLTREGPLPIAEAARIVREVASALSHAHQHGVVHRDIKPENVLLVDGTHAVVADFGLALAILRSADRNLTRSSHVVGTASYMSPEQAASGKNVDGRADIYSVGCMFYEMLAGRPPFDGDSPYAVIAQHVSAKPPRLAELRSGIPAAVEQVVQRALEKAPAHRYQTAAELCADLDAALAAGRRPWYANAGIVTRAVDRMRPDKGDALPFPLAGTRPRWRLARLSVLVGIGLLLAAAAAWAAIPVEARARIRTLIDRGDPGVVSNRIVVAPFEDFTGEPQLARFGAYASHVVTGELASAGIFEVVDEKTSYMNGKIVDATPRMFRDDDRAVALAKETAAGLLVSGSYSHERDSIRVHVQLTDVAADRVINTHKVAGALHEKDRLVDDLATRVVAMAAVMVDTSAASTPFRRTNPPSFDSYAEVVQAWDRYAHGDLEGFYRHARRAAEKDSLYMMPVLMQAYTRSDARDWAAADSLVRLLERHPARLAGRMSAIEHAGTEMLRAAARGDMAGHLRGALAVRDASPGSAEVRTYAARVAVNANQPRLALAILTEVDPSRGMMLAAPWYWNWASAAYHMLADHEKELAHAREGLRRFPTTETAVANHGRASAVTGDLDELHKLLGRLPRPGEPTAHRRWKIAIDWARELRAHGHPGKSRRLLETLLRELQGTLAHRNPASARFRATVLGDLGRSADSYVLWTQLVARSPESLEALGNLGVAAARVGNRAKAQQVEQLIGGTTWPYAHGRDAMWQARISAALGDTARAETMVEMAQARGYSRFFDPGGGLYDEPEVHTDPVLEPLRTREAFKRLLEPKG